MEEDELSDEFLIDAIAGGAMWALERLYHRYSGRFYALAYRMTADKMVAEELVQDAFLCRLAKRHIIRSPSGPSSRLALLYHLPPCH